ncbi:MAG TPA: sigma-54 dependent transcriptional regulator, partial [Kofleriaceae bacterium]|nr:sigma-54 dependent transcriptional regulator [Kofleriaceae bacterium]
AGGVDHGASDRVLVVDDDPDALVAMAQLLRVEGYETDIAEGGATALAKLESFSPDLLLTDLVMPGMDGLELVRRAREIDPETVAIVMTAYGGVDSAVTAMRDGATDFIAKPFRLPEVLRVAEPALARRRLRIELARAYAENHPLRAGHIVGASPVMTDMLETVAQVARSRASVLVTGESGTGKEMVARAIHHLSPRAAAPFIAVHCGALAESVLESELFGHERGAFTGAAVRRQGRFEQADGGTLFFDEIGDIPASIQVKLLRFLQERELERVGGNQTIRVDVRVVAATNADLKEMVRAGTFREDLLYRLDVVSIQVPPLRERAGDVPLLAAHFLSRFCREEGRAIRGFTAEAATRLLTYGWPGNVRELENAVGCAAVKCAGNEIGRDDLPPEVGGTNRHGSAAPVIPGATLAEIEKHAILSTLEQTGGSTSRAAKMLGISVRTIQNRLRRYRIDDGG